MPHTIRAACTRSVARKRGGRRQARRRGAAQAVGSHGVQEARGRGSSCRAVERARKHEVDVLAGVGARAQWAGPALMHGDVLPTAERFAATAPKHCALHKQEGNSQRWISAGSPDALGLPRLGPLVKLPLAALEIRRGGVMSPAHAHNQEQGEGRAVAIGAGARRGRRRSRAGGGGGRAAQQGRRASHKLRHTGSCPHPKTKRAAPLHQAPQHKHQAHVDGAAAHLRPWTGRAAGPWQCR